MNKLAIITGASRGIGLAAAQLFLVNGYQIINLSRSPGVNTNPLQGVYHYPVDFLSANFIDAIKHDLLSKLEAAEEICLVHNAAMLEKDSTTNLSEKQFEDVLKLNVIVPSMLNQLCLPFMKQGSSIVYVGSTLSRKAVANSCSYVSSKHALLGLMRATCQDLKGSGIHTAMVLPGFTDTEMLRAHIGHDESILQSLAQNVLMGRLATPEEIAQIIYNTAITPVLNGAEIDANLGQLEY